MASGANVLKNVSWLSSSGSRAAINLSLSAPQKNSNEINGRVGNNIGELSAKCGTQSTAASLVGTSIGIFLAQYATRFAQTNSGNSISINTLSALQDYIQSGSFSFLCSSFAFISTFHLFAVWKSCRHLKVSSLMDHFLNLTLPSNNLHRLPSYVLSPLLSSISMSYIISQKDKRSDIMIVHEWNSSESVLFGSFRVPLV